MKNLLKRLYVDRIAFNLLKKFLFSFRCSHGYRFVARADDYWRFIGHFEPKTTAFIDSIVKPTDVVVDVGAHIGIHTVHFATRARRVVALEPEPFNYQLLKRNIKLNKLSNVMAIRCATSDFDGSAYLYVAENSGSHTLELSRIHKAVRTIKVPCRRLDTLLGHLGVPHVDIVKIDVEGHEHSVLKGMSKLSPPKVLIVETKKASSIIELLNTFTNYRLLDQQNSTANFAFTI